MKMLTNCPLGKKETHACWECLFNGHRESNIAFNPQGKKCIHTDYKETMKIKPRKITHAFCAACGKSVKFCLDWDGVASPTRKGVIIYKELYAYCPHCDNQVYVPAVNDVNVYRRNKAYAAKVPELISIPIASGDMAKVIEKMMEVGPSVETEQAIENLKKLFAGRDK